MEEENEISEFIVVGDLHCKDKLVESKRDVIGRIIEKIKDNNNIKVVVCPGDLTTSGRDGSRLCCWRYGGIQNQLKVLKESVVKPLEELARVYLCPGNHDTYIKHPRLFEMPVLEYIKDKHSNILYYFKFSLTSSLRFVCLGIYPDGNAISFLKEIFKSYPKDDYV